MGGGEREGIMGGKGGGSGVYLYRRRSCRSCLGRRNLGIGGFGVSWVDSGRVFEEEM